MKKVISIDFDGVIIEKVLGRDWKSQKNKPNAESGVLTPIYKMINKWWATINHTWRKPVWGVREGLIKLKNIGYKLVLLTSRQGCLREVAMRWLKKWGLYEFFDEFYFNEKNIGGVDSKIENMKIIEADWHIDDNWDTVIGLTETYPNLQVYWLSNKKEIKKVDRIKRAENWSDIKI